MGERKVLNKYFPPDFDPAKLPRGKRVRCGARGSTAGGAMCTAAPRRAALLAHCPADSRSPLHTAPCRSEDKQMKVRMMLPMSVRCNTCGTFLYKGTKFNTRMEDVRGEDYLGIKIFRFYYRCTACSAEFCMKTDPKNADYVVEGGATRNYEPWREKEAAKVGLRGCERERSGRRAG